VIALGRVLEVRPGPGGDLPQSEHDAIWQTAIVQVEAYAKEKPADNIPVYFPTSDDIAWFRSPRFKPQDSGVFLIQRQPLDWAGREQRQYTALHPLDFFPSDRIPDVVRKRLRPTRGKEPMYQQTPVNPKSNKAPREPVVK
jgi:hypothetical protein